MSSCCAANFTSAACFKLCVDAIQARFSVCGKRHGVAPQAGSLQLEGSELRFETSADGRAQDVIRKQELAVMATVAEAMIAANCAVARRVLEAFPQAALLRRHAPPRPEAFAEVAFRPSLAGSNPLSCVYCCGTAKPCCFFFCCWWWWWWCGRGGRRFDSVKMGTIDGSGNSFSMQMQ